MRSQEQEAAVQRQMAALVQAYPGMAGMSEQEMSIALSDCACEVRKQGFMSLVYAGILIAFAVAFVSLGMYSKYGSGYSLVAAVGSYVLLVLWLRSAWRSQLRAELSRRFGGPQKQRA